MKQPPFARGIEGQRDIRIYCGGERAWDRARYWSETGGARIAAVVLPDPNPEAYDWRCVRGADVMVLHVGDFPSEALERLGAALVQAGANRVVIGYVTSQGMRSCGFTGGYDFAVTEPEGGWLP